VQWLLSINIIRNSLQEIFSMTFIQIYSEFKIINFFRQWPIYLIDLSYEFDNWVFLRLPLLNVLSSMAPRSVRFGVRSRKLSTIGRLLDRWSKIYYLEFFRAFGKHVKPLVPAAITIVRTHQALVVGYGPFSLCVIHKKGLCPSSGDINRLMMMLNVKQTTYFYYI
jgi:hypothetical protein